MKLTIANFDGLGSEDYTVFVDSTRNPSVLRKLNRPAELRFSLVAGAGSLTVPVIGARVRLSLSNGNNLFTGYIVDAPIYQYMGCADRGMVYRYEIAALSDVMLLDKKAPPAHPPFVDRNAGDAFAQLASEAIPGLFDVSGVEAGDSIPYYSVDPEKKWTTLAAEIALLGRCAYRDDDGKLFFAPLGTNIYSLTEDVSSFSPSDLKLQSVSRLVNDLMVLGPLEPSAFVKDYFVGDGLTSRFYMSQKPFTRSSQVALYNRTILNETYAELDASRWSVTDPRSAITVSNGQLQVAGGTGIDGQTLLTFIERVELGGTTVMTHGDVVFNAASDGVIGGLYADAVSIAGCLAGFRITPAGANCNIQVLIEGSVTGAALSTQPGHHYVFSTQLYPTETYRRQQVFHSSSHPSGMALGGGEVAADVRVVLEVHDIDPADPGSRISPAIVLYDDVIANAPGFCTYALMNGGSMQCSIAFTNIWLPTNALVRSTAPGGDTATVLPGSLLDGAACHITTSPTLEFYPESTPLKNQLIKVIYRGQSHAAARVTNSASIAAGRRGGDDGVRGSVREVGLPVPRTSADCEAAALALLDDAAQGWQGEYQAWNQFLPSGDGDLFPGDGLAIDAPSRMASFTAIVREVEVEIVNLADETCRYTLRFTDAGDFSLSFSFVTALYKQTRALTPVDASLVGDVYLPDLVDAELVGVTSTTATVDVGFTPVAGGGIEVRYSDAGWGAGYSGNLAGRFTSSSFTLTRYARGQTYFLRRYDGSGPPRYSRYSTAIHVDYPLNFPIP